MTCLMDGRSERWLPLHDNSSYEPITNILFLPLSILSFRVHVKLSYRIVSYRYSVIADGRRSWRSSRLLTFYVYRALLTTNYIQEASLFLYTPSCACGSIARFLSDWLSWPMLLVIPRWFTRPQRLWASECPDVKLQMTASLGLAQDAL